MVSALPLYKRVYHRSATTAISAELQQHLRRQSCLLQRLHAHPGQITLTARGYKVRGRHTVDLFSTGATSSNVDIYRNGVLIVTTLNDRFYTDSPGSRGPGTYTYRVCNAGSQARSNQATVKFGAG